MPDAAELLMSLPELIISVGGSPPGQVKRPNPLRVVVLNSTFRPLSNVTP